MAPTKTDTGHGALFDSFPDRPTSLHGGAKFDEGFNLQPKPAGRAGRNFDEWGAPTAPENAEHGEIFDDWREWTSMPDAHGGTMFDEGFGEHTANESSQGPLFDLFEPSTQVKFIYDGQDSEGIVDHVREDGVVMVAPRGGGKAVEVDLGQFLGYRSPSMDNATTTAERSTAEAPSAWDQFAHGAKRGAAPDIGTPVQSVGEGPGNTNGRSDIGADWSVVDHLKMLLSGDDVAKVFSMEPSTAGNDPKEAGVVGRRLIGQSVQTHPDRVVAGYHHANGSVKMLDGHFGSHDEAHSALVKAHGRYAHKTADSALDVLKSTLGVPEQHQLRVARQTVHMNPGIAGVMGGPSIHEAHDTIRRLTGRTEPHAFTPGRGKGGCDYCPHPAEHGAHNIGGRMANKTRPRLPSDVLNSYSEWSGVTTIAKDVTVAETAVQAEEGRSTLAGAKGAGSYCPECRESKRKLTDDGRCPDCQTVIKAHEPGMISREKGDGNGSSEDSSTPGVSGKTMPFLSELRKAFGAAADPGAGGQTVTIDPSRPGPKNTGQATSDPDGPEVPEREHKDSDHHGNLSGVPTTCPHCGQVLAELDAKTEEGAPTHKCVEGFLDTLKGNETHPGGQAVSPLDVLKGLVAA